METKSERIFANGGWGCLLSPEVRADLTAKRAYNYQSTFSLIRAIRNKHQHFNDLDEDKKSLYLGFSSKKSRNPNEKDTTYIKFWLVKYPSLIIETWAAFQSYRKDLSFYYPDIHNYKYQPSLDERASEMVDFPAKLLKEAVRYERRKNEREEKKKTDNTTILVPNSSSASNTVPLEPRKPAHIRLKESRNNSKEKDVGSLSNTPKLSRNSSLNDDPVITIKCVQVQTAWVLKLAN